MNNVVNLRCLQLKERKALMELVTRLHENFSHIVRHMLLFGSKVRGGSSAESDIDLLIVVEEYDWALEKEITRLVTQTDYAYEVILSDHIISNARFKQMAARREPLYRTLEVEGIDLWMLEPQSII